MEFISSNILNGLALDKNNACTEFVDFKHSKFVERVKIAKKTFRGFLVLSLS